MPMDGKKWTVQVPIEDIIALYGAMQEHDRTAAENSQLRREDEGLRNMQSECMLLISDLRRQLNNR